jgi:hypothetical protein
MSTTGRIITKSGFWNTTLPKCTNIPWRRWKWRVILSFSICFTLQWEWPSKNLSLKMSLNFFSVFPITYCYIISFSSFFSFLNAARLSGFLTVYSLLNFFFLYLQQYLSFFFSIFSICLSLFLVEFFLSRRSNFRC